MSAPEDSDRLVQGTSNDAAISRESAARLGYIADPFIQHFVRHPQRRAPLINRGTFTRFQGVQKTLRQFLRHTSQNQQQQQQQTQNQVVILGSGLDTSYFLLAKDNIRAKRYFEMDFAEINAKKAATIYKKPDMRRLLPADTKVAAGGCELHSEEYCLLSGDLRLFAQDIVPRLLEHGFDTSAPTLFVSECVLIYLDPQHSDSIIDWITESVANAAILTYEQILPSDRFGQMMIENLRARGLELRGLMAYPSLESTRDRFLSRGWVSAAAIDLSDYHKKAIPQSELSRLARIEFLDEWEEFSLLAKHYAFTLAHTTHSKSFASIKLI